MRLVPYARRGAVAAIVLAGGLLAGNLAAPAAHAAVACRSDPILLVNGDIVDVVSVLQTAPGAVRELDYTVTVPVGSLLSTLRLTVGLGFPERVTYVYSPAQPWGTMSIAATVQTQAGTAPFATTVQVTSLWRHGAASGLSDSTVWVALGSQLML